MAQKRQWFRLLFALFLTICISASLVGLQASSATLVHAASGNGTPTDANIVYVGRWDTSSASVTTSYWPGAYLKTDFTGTTAQLHLGGSANIYVSIDNGPDIYYAGANGTVNLTPTPLAAGTHSVRIAARSEWDNIQFQGLTLDSGATTVKPTTSPQLIEFIGDSITSGLTDSKAALSDYAWLTGENLGVEHTQIAFSGVCLVDNCNGKQNSPGMETQYFKEQTFLSTNSPDWDFSRYQASEVVINLGQNDGTGTDPATFQSAYTTFLQNIRQKYPNAAIFALSTFLGIQVAATQAAVAARQAAGDANVYYIDTTGWITYGPDYNDGAHPSESGHALIAQHLAPILQSHLHNPPTAIPGPTPDPNLPATWYSQDVGSVSDVGLTGSDSYSNGTFSVTGSGSDIGNAGSHNADAFHFAYQPLHGDGTIVARVSSQQNTNASAKAGVMIRETLALGSMFALTAITPGNGSIFERRDGTAGATSSLATTTSGPDVTVPYWVKLVRQGSTFTSSVSNDGTNWTQVGSDTIPMATNVFIGLAVTAYDNTQRSTATFDQVNTPSTSTGIANGHYVLTNQNSGLVLDNTYGGGVGNHEQQWGSNGTANQHWSIQGAGNGYYTITCDNNGLALDVDGQSTNQGAAIVLQNPTGGDSQLWQITNIGGGDYTITNKHSGDVLDVSGAATNAGAPVIQWPYHTGTNQQWQLQAIA